jgi:hypothetical protein
VGGSERHYYRGGVGNYNFLFEGSQALPASPSDKGEAGDVSTSTRNLAIAI